MEEIKIKESKWMEVENRKAEVRRNKWEGKTKKEEVKDICSYRRG